MTDYCIQAEVRRGGDDPVNREEVMDFNHSATKVRSSGAWRIESNWAWANENSCYDWVDHASLFSTAHACLS